MVHGRQRSRNRSLDGTILKGDAAALAQEGARLQALGEKFVEDKEKLGACMERVKKSRMAAADKVATLAELTDAMERVQDQYARDVTLEQQRLQEEQREVQETMQEAADEWQRQSDDLHAVRMAAAGTDASAAADEADRQKEKFDQMKAEAVEKLRLQMNQAAAQQRRILSQRLSDR